MNSNLDEQVEIGKEEFIVDRVGMTEWIEFDSVVLNFGIIFYG